MKTFLALILSFAAALSHAATSPLDGTWKTNPAKSNLAGDVVTYTKTATGYKRTGGGSGAELDFAIDGKEYKDKDGWSQSWTSAGTNAWDIQSAVNGKVTGTRHLVLSGDGKTLTSDYTDENLDGTKTHGHVVRTRVGAGTGLVGTWKNVQQTEDPSIMVFSTPSPGHVRFESNGEVLEGPTDGSEFEMKSPTVPPGWMASLRMTNPRELAWAGGFKGKPEVKGTNTVSADGKTLTAVSWAVGEEDKKTTVVYDKQ